MHYHEQMRPNPFRCPHRLRLSTFTRYTYERRAPRGAVFGGQMKQTQGVAIALGAALGYLFYEGGGLALGAGIGLALSGVLPTRDEDGDD